MVARKAHNLEAAGSIPVSAKIKTTKSHTHTGVWLFCVGGGTDLIFLGGRGADY